MQLENFWSFLFRDGFRTICVSLFSFVLRHWILKLIFCQRHVLNFNDNFIKIGLICVQNFVLITTCLVMFWSTGSLRHNTVVLPLHFSSYIGFFMFTVLISRIDLLSKVGWIWEQFEFLFLLNFTFFSTLLLSLSPSLGFFIPRQYHHLMRLNKVIDTRS